MFAIRSRICHFRNFHSPNEFCKESTKLVNSYLVNVSHSRTQNCFKHNYAKPPVDQPQDELRGANTELPYKVIDPHSARLTSLLTKAKSRRLRYQNKTIMLEGKRLIIDALVAGVRPIMILFTRKHLINDLPLLDRYVTPERTVLHKIPYHQLQNWSDLTTSPGITGIFEMPHLENRVLPFPTLPITLVCDNIREPGNLGSILRIAAAIPVRRVVLISGCVDLWDTKVTRSSCGAMFNLRIENNASWEDVWDTCSGNVIIADHLYANEDKESSIPAEDYVENVDHEDEPEEKDEDDDEILDPVQMRQVTNVPIVPYHKITYKQYDSFVIVVGGETEGLSEQSFLYAQEKKGVRVNIPIAPVVNSLNAATALGIITFEIKRQLEVE